MPLPPQIARALDPAAGERPLRTTSARPLGAATPPPRGDADRAAAGECGGNHQAHLPHSLRHSFITACLEAGVPLRDVQIAARHADRTTTRYDRARHNLDRHASYIVTAFIAGAS
ncbi:MAG TPA: site-specific integrase [Acidimicrobiales bacterium]|nr:site-specific integrase [Acidimicrobiales bacterium]